MIGLGDAWQRILPNGEVACLRPGDGVAFSERGECDVLTVAGQDRDHFGCTASFEYWISEMKSCIPAVACATDGFGAELLT